MIHIKGVAQCLARSWSSENVYHYYYYYYYYYY